jgi:hypothetical protein
MRCEFSCAVCSHARVYSHSIEVDAPRIQEYQKARMVVSLRALAFPNLTQIKTY